jgi:hypothetical protein
LSFNISNYKHIWQDDPRGLLKDYKYQPELTKKLDQLTPQKLTTENMYEIVLWKLNRFPQIEQKLIDSLKALEHLGPNDHRNASKELRKLLSCPGVALPMASTILRFLNPKTFQIIDDRVYRIVNPGKAKYPTKPLNINERYLKTCESIYFDYLDELQKLSCEKLPFECADRILYLLDIKLGNRIGNKS